MWYSRASCKQLKLLLNYQLYGLNIDAKIEEIIKPTTTLSQPLLSIKTNSYNLLPQMIERNNYIIITLVSLHSIIHWLTSLQAIRMTSTTLWKYQTQITLDPMGSFIFHEVTHTFLTDCLLGTVS